MDQQPLDLLIRNAGHVVTMVGPDVPGGWVGCRDGVVQAVGPAGSEPPAAEVVDARGAIVTPGLVNAHHHLFQNLTRAHADSSACTLGPWLEMLRPVWALLDRETAYLSAWIGLADLALAGCTTTGDNLYLHPVPGLVEETLRAAAEVGLRLDPTRGYIDRQRLDVPGAEDADAVLEASRTLLEEWHDPTPGSRCRVSLGPTALPATRTSLLPELAALAAEHDARLHLHLFEEGGENDRARELHGRGAVELLLDSGWADRSWIAHGNHVDAADAAALAAGGIGLAHCPSSNLLLGGPVARLDLLDDAGVAVGLGTDGAASAGTSQLWLEARTALLLQRQHRGADAFSARRALELATTGAAACLGRAGEVGGLAPGMQADLVVWETSGPAYAGAVTDPVETWLRCGPPRARHTIVGGRAVVRDGALVADGLDEHLDLHRKHAVAWQTR